jgi:hypothetical protein
MAEHETAAPWLLPYPDPTGKAKLGALNFKELAERLTAIFKERFLSIATHAASYAAVSGELGVQEKAGETTTLPAATTKDRIVGVFCKAASCKITTSGGAFIQGDFITIASKTATITLLEGQHVILQSDGTNWLIIAGEPLRAAKYSALEAFAPLAAGQKVTWTNPSATREAWVNLTVSCNASASFGVNAQLRVGGVHAGDFFSSENAHSVAGGTAVLLAPGESLEVECTIGGGGTTVTVSLSYRPR